MSEMGTVGRVMISYAHESDDHVRVVGDLADFLRGQGFDARLDQYATGERQDWVRWTLEQMHGARHVVVVCSPAYRRRFEQEAPPEEGRGVQLESLLIREDIMRDQVGAVRRYLPVLLGDATVDSIPTLLQPYAGTHYRVPSITDSGCAALLRVLSGRPDRVPPPIGPSRSAPPSWPKIIACLHVNGGSALDRDEVARAFVAPAAGDPSAAAIEFGPGGSVSGALLTAPPDDPEDLVGRGVRGVHERAEAIGGTVTARIGGHVADGPDDDTARHLVDSVDARALHRAPGGRTVAAVSPAFYDLVRGGVITSPRAPAYRSAGGNWFAVPARSTCPEIPGPELEAPRTLPAQDVGPRILVGQNHGVIHTVTGDSTLHIGDVINYMSPPR